MQPFRVKRNQSKSPKDGKDGYYARPSGPRVNVFSKKLKYLGISENMSYVLYYPNKQISPLPEMRPHLIFAHSICRRPMVAVLV